MTGAPDLRALRRTVQRSPADAASHERLARALLAAEDLPALAALQPALDNRFAELPFTHLIAGHAAKAAGHGDAAAQRYRRALKLRPASGEALYNLVDLEGISLDDAEVRQLTALAERRELPAADRINILFARARVLERSGDPEQAFHYYRLANDLARDNLEARGVSHDASAAERQLAADLANWQPPLFQTPLPPSGIDLTPVFVIGLPRSGTTLVEQIIASHPEVSAGGELTLGPSLEHDFRRRLALGPLDPVPSPDSNAVRRELELARERYLDGLFARGLDARWIVDKLPANARIAGFLRLLFPDAPIVHCDRDPRALAWSLYTANFAAHEPWVHQLDAMAGVLRRHRQLLAHWRAVLPPPFLDVRYEALVQEPGQRIRELLAACHVPFDAATLHPEALDRPVFTASHAQVRRPIHSDAVERWRPQARHLSGFAEP